MGGTPQFGTAEYSSSTAEVCRACHQPVGATYYRAKDAMLCASCAESLQRQVPQDSHAAFVRAIIFGLGGFVVGLTVYAGFSILTGIEIGYVSLAVGWLVGKAMMMGSGGVGGRRYQIAAVLLTYAAVSMAFIPIVLHAAWTHDNSPSATHSPLVPPPPPGSSASSSQPAANPEPPAHAESPDKLTFLSSLGRLALLGLASPFLELKDGFSGLIGLVILFVGMQFAWKMTRGATLAITGPYQLSSSAKT